MNYRVHLIEFTGGTGEPYRVLHSADANGMFRRRYVGDSEYIYGWRCYRHEQPIERHGKAWDANSARKSYEAHMGAKHPVEGEINEESV